MRRCWLAAGIFGLVAAGSCRSGGGRAGEVIVECLRNPRQAMCGWVEPSPSPKASPTPTVCPDGSHLHYFSADPVAAMCVPDEKPSPSPQPSPSPSPSSSPGCRIPQGAKWKILPGARFLLEQRVDSAISQVTGMTEEDAPVYAGRDAQVFFGQVSGVLRKWGLCAGQHEDGKTDEICVGATPDRCEGYHVYHYKPGNVIWTPNSNRNVWVRVDGDEEPSPEPSPSTRPGPGNGSVVACSIRATSSVVGPGGWVRYTCQGRTGDGKVARPPNLFNESVPPGSRIGGMHFTAEEDAGGYSEVIRVKSNCPAGIIRVSCSWYQAPRECSTENLGVEVRP